MSRQRGREQSVFANPVLVGALTVLVTIVAVTLAYNANNGLPFVPRYTLNVQVRDASELTHGGDVRLGGTLVGFVNSVTAARDSDGRPIAVLNLKLDKSIQPLPIDTRFAIRLKGAIGLKYLQVLPGSSGRGFEDGATVPVSQSSATVDLDQVLSMFTPKTRAGVAASTLGFAAGLAGRGSDLNDAIGAFVPLLGDLAPVARNLASRQTDLAGFFRGLEGFASAVAPVAPTQATLFVNLDTTFRALASVAVPFLQDWISQTPPTFQAVITDSPIIRPFLTDTGALFEESRPLVATARQNAPVLANVFAIGTRNLPGTAVLDQRLVSLSDRLASYGQTPSVRQGLDRLTLTMSSLRKPLAFLTPVQSSCNYVTLFLRNVSSLLSENSDSGTALRFVIVAIDDVLGGEAVPSHQPFLTPGTPGAGHGPLHVNPYPNTDSPGQTPECAAGNEPYSVRSASIGNPPGNVGLNTESTSGGSG
jgi:phospholipid/cholesterol/gamma-HCH transport system substrate-binding protein